MNTIIFVGLLLLSLCLVSMASSAETQVEISAGGSTSTFLVGPWFSFIFPQPPIPNPCLPTPGSDWVITKNLTCVYDSSNSTVVTKNTNVTAIGSIQAYGLNLSTQNFTQYRDDDTLASTFENQELYFNANWTIEGATYLKNVTVYMNLSVSYQAIHINLTSNGSLFVYNSIITAGGRNDYQFRINNGSHLTIENSSLRNHSGLAISTPHYNFSNVSIQNASGGVVLGGGANHSNLSHVRFDGISGGSGTLTIQGTSVRDITLTDINITTSGRNTGNIYFRNSKHLRLNQIRINLSSPTLATAEPMVAIENTRDFNMTNTSLTKHVQGNPGFACRGCNETLVEDTNITGSVQGEGIRLELDQYAADYARHDNVFRRVNVRNSSDVSVDGWATAILVGGDAYQMNNNTLFIDSNLSAEIVVDVQFLNGTVVLHNTTTQADQGDKFGYGLSSFDEFVNVSWPVSILVQDQAANPLETALVQTRNVNLTKNTTNTTGASGYVRYINLTEFSASYGAGNYSWQGNYTVNASKVGYVSASVSLNVSGPNSTIVVLFVDTGPLVNLTYPLNKAELSLNWTTLNWTYTDNLSSTGLCNVTFNGSLIVTNGAVLNNSANFTTVYNLTNGNYAWSVTCCDMVGNCTTGGPFTFNTDISAWEPAAALLLLNTGAFILWSVRMIML